MFPTISQFIHDHSRPFAIPVLLLLYPSLNAQFNIGNGEVKELYNTYCASCHGEQLQGGQGSPLIDDVWAYGSTDDNIIEAISEGIANTPMIPYKNVLDEKQIRGLLVYIKEQREIIDKAQLGKRLQPQDGIFKSEQHDFKLEKVAEGQFIDANGNPEGETTADATLWGFAFLPDYQILATQRNGVLWRFAPNGNATQIKGLPPIWRPGAESGLFDIVLHPNYSENGWIYLSFSETQDEGSTGMTAIVRGRIRNDQWTNQNDIYRSHSRFHNEAKHHFGGRMTFKDNYLYLSIGDRVAIKDSQDLTSPFGKILRLHDDGRIPEDNPFVGTTGASKAIWSYGNRNAQGFAIHPNTGDLWATEHGPRGGDELNIIRKAQNYGWPVITHGINYDGKPITHLTQQEGMLQPIIQWTPSIATSGIAFYTGDQFPQWTGDLFVGGMWAEELHRLKIEKEQVLLDEVVLKNQGRVRHVVNAPDGHLYLSLTTGAPRKGAIYKIIKK